MAPLVVYSRRGCHLCEQLLEELVVFVGGRLRIEIRDVDSRPDWRERFDTRVPVVEHDGRILSEYRLDRDRLAVILPAVPAPPARR